MFNQWRAQGDRVSSYVDDGIFMARSYEAAIKLRDKVLVDLEALGFCLNRDKVCLEPQQAVTYLGFELRSTPTCYITVGRTKLERVRSDVRGYLQSLRRNPAHRFKGRTLAALVGRLIAMREALPPARLCTRELLRCLWQLPAWEVTGPSSHNSNGKRAQPTRWLQLDYDATVPLTPGAVAELHFWAKRIGDWNGMEYKMAAPSVILYTDASGEGWGGLVQRVLSPAAAAAAQLLMQGQFPIDMSHHSVYTEARGLLEALVTGGAALRGQVVRHRTDNLSTFYLVRNGGCNGKGDLSIIAKKIWWVCMLLDIQLQSEFVGSKVIIHVGADRLSREFDSEDQRLRKRVFRRLWDRWGPFERDLFACPLTAQKYPISGHQLPFFSHVLTQGALGLDALSQEWEVPSYGFPPMRMAGEAVLAALRAPAPTVLILPDWPSQPWSPLLARADVEAVPLGRAMDVTRPGPSGRRRMVEAEATWHNMRLTAYRFSPNV